MKTVYLAGPMTNIGGKERDHSGQIILAEWREKVMKRAHGYKFMYPEQAENSNDEIDHIPQYDLAIIRLCDIVIAYIDAPDRIGTFCEISAAYAMGKQIKIVGIEKSTRPTLESEFWNRELSIPWFVQELVSYDCINVVELIPYEDSEPDGRPSNIAKNMKDAERIAIDEIVNLLGGDRVDYYEYIKSAEWKSKADAAKERAGGKCQICNKAGNLNAHHRTYERLGKELPEDITVLCRDCHELYELNRKAKKAGK